MENNLPILRMPSQSLRLPDNNQWQHRFEIRSETSNRVYVVAQNKAKKYWGCSCPGWRTRRNCKHLTAMGLPNHERPHEVKLAENAQSAEAGR